MTINLPGAWLSCNVFDASQVVSSGSCSYKFFSSEINRANTISELIENLELQNFYYLLFFAVSEKWNFYVYHNIENPQKITNVFSVLLYKNEKMELKNLRSLLKDITFSPITVDGLANRALRCILEELQRKNIDVIQMRASSNTEKMSKLPQSAKPLLRRKRHFTNIDSQEKHNERNVKIKEDKLILSIETLLECIRDKHSGISAEYCSQQKLIQIRIPKVLNNTITQGIKNCLYGAYGRKGSSWLLNISEEITESHTVLQCNVGNPKPASSQDTPQPLSDKTRQLSINPTSSSFSRKKHLGNPSLEELELKSVHSSSGSTRSYPSWTDSGDAGTNIDSDHWQTSMAAVIK